MFKMKKLAAVAAAAVMAVSAMAVSVSAASISTDPPAYSPYGYFRGMLTIAPVPLGTAKGVTSDTVLLGSSNAPEVVAELTIRRSNTGSIWYEDARSTYNSAYASLSVQANSPEANQTPITAESAHKVGNGNGYFWETNELTLRG